MALSDYKNRVSPRTNLSVRGERLEGKDRKIFEASDTVPMFGDNPNDIIVKRLYDDNDNLMGVRFDKSAPILNPETGDILVYPRRDIREFGYTTGRFKIEYLFWRFLVGNNNRPGVWVQEISNSRSEIKIQPTDDSESGSEFISFKNNVLTEDEAFEFINDLFFELSIDSVKNSFQPTFLDKLLNDFNMTEDRLDQVLQLVIDDATVKIADMLTRRGAAGLNELRVIVNTALQESILTHFTVIN